MANAPARNSAKKRVGTVRCPMSDTVCDVFTVRLGNRHAERLYYRSPVVGTIQCYGPAGQAWLRANMVADQPAQAEPPAAQPVQVTPQPAAQPEPEPPQQPENDEQRRFLMALGRA